MVDPPASQAQQLHLSVTPGGVARLQSHPLLRALSQGRPRTLAFSCVAFDTAERDLAHAGLVLRIRSVGRSFAQCVEGREQAEGDPFARRSSEATLREVRPAPERIADPALRARLEAALAGKPLLPVFEVVVRRTRRLLEEEDETVELVLDVGEVHAGDRRLPLHDLRLDLRRGATAYLHRLALELQEEVPLRLQTASVWSRAESLATGERPAPRKAGALVLPGRATVEELLAGLVRSGLEQVLANEVPAWEGNDPEGVHQLRVGVRRLRSTLALFGRMLPERDNERLKEELRWLGAATGPARDLDVFLEDLIEPLTRRFPDDPGLKRLRDEARELREESYAHVRAALDSPRHARLGLLLHRWWAERSWRDQRLSAESARLFAPAGREVADLLGRRHRQALRLGRNLAARPVSEKHALRIQLKKLRYAADAARTLFPRKRTDRYLARLADLQDVLGHLNDLAAAEQILARVIERLGPEAGPSHHHAAGFVAGWAAAGAERRLRRLDRQWKAFAAATPFWAE